MPFESKDSEKETLRPSGTSLTREDQREHGNPDQKSPLL